MRFVRLLACAAAMLLATATVSLAADKPSADDAKALTVKAAELIGAKGLDAARAVLHEEGEFKHGELYVNVINSAGTWLVYPPTPSAEGRSVIDIQDSSGKFLVRDIIKVAKDQGEGWVDYRWMNPATRQIAPKTTFVKLVPDTDMIVYVGVYK